MKIAIPREVFPGEQRVAATPASVAQLVGMGFDVTIESRAGVRASFPDEQYVAAGASIAEGPEATYADADLVLKVCEPTEHPSVGKHEVELLPEGAFVASFFWPAQNQDLLERCAARKLTMFAMDQVPRVTRAQKMDALSSMANIVGYRAVVEAANRFGRFFAGQITAAGRIPPAKVLVIGAGVAGLAAIAAARGLGAIVRAFDVRPEVAEQITSLGGEFLQVDIEETGDGGGGYAKEMSKEFLEAEHKLFLEQAAEVDIVITTALIPGKPAPKLWTKDMVEAMKPGSVVVDLASIQGGNCDLTRQDEVVEHNGVHIVGFSDFTSRLATTASQLYSTNLVNMLEDMMGDDGFVIDMDDDVVGPSIVTHAGKITWPPPKRPAPPAAPTPAPPPPPAAKPEPVAAAAAPAAPRRNPVAWAVTIGLAGLWIWLRMHHGSADASPQLKEFVEHFTVFVLACFVGWQVVWSVTPALHTPLMSVTNAISGIIILGGIVAGTSDASSGASILGALAVLFASINIAGGFLVTQRMLKMFRKD